MIPDIAIVLPEGTYLVPASVLQVQTTAETLVWLRVAWRVVLHGGPAANDAQATIERYRGTSAHGPR